MVKCYIGIGSNIGNRRIYIDRAINELRCNGEVVVLRVSSIYETDPVSDIPQDKYLNGVIEIETRLKPKVLLRLLNKIEDGLGRVRAAVNGPRTIDLDILYYGNEIVREEGLVIPHPRIGEREFVLKGLRELGKGARGPIV